jgi:hypothetical protein
MLGVCVRSAWCACRQRDQDLAARLRAVIEAKDAENAMLRAELEATSTRRQTTA